jgi:hypothetical protein
MNELGSSLRTTIEGTFARGGVRLQWDQDVWEIPRTPRDEGGGRHHRCGDAAIGWPYFRPRDRFAGCQGLKVEEHGRAFPRIIASASGASIRCDA